MEIPRAGHARHSDTFGGYASHPLTGTYASARLRDCPQVAGRWRRVQVPGLCSRHSQAVPGDLYLFKRLGVKGARMEMSATLPNDPSLPTR